MFVIKCSILLILPVLVSTSNVNKRQKPVQNNNFYYPEEMWNKNKVSHDRIPIVDKTRCKENEYLYPGDHPSDWTCDCKPGFIFYPNDGGCYEAYRRGPCRNGEILIIQKSQKSPKCIINQCKKDGLVLFKDKCQQLDSTEPCKQFNYLIGRKTYLTIKEPTFELICADNDRIYECNSICCVDSRGTRQCFRGRLRNSQRKI